jgi:hypothetical protein
MKIASQLMNGLVYDANLVSRDGKEVLELQEGEYLSPEDATYGEFAIVEATTEDRDALRKAGYDLSDYEAPAPECPASWEQESGEPGSAPEGSGQA